MQSNKERLATLLSYFVRGLLLTVPFALTMYIISLALNWIDGLIGLKIPGLGMAILVVSITFFGYLGSTLLMKSAFDLTERFITKVPLINVVYSSLKEFLGAFVGKEKKFDKPVLVMLNKVPSVQKLGFITHKDLQQIHLPGSMAVYLPHSYNFSGDLYIVPKESVMPIDISSSEVMKFILSGGVTGIQRLEEKGGY